MTATSHPADDPGLRLLAGLTLGPAVEAIRPEMAAAVERPEEIEHVHRMRVASRRVRAGLAGLGDVFRPKRTRRWRKEIRRITKRLGDARDLDVQAASLGRFLEELQTAAARPGLERLRLRTRQARARMQPRVVEAIERLGRSGVLEEIEAASRELVIESRLEAPEPRTPAVYGEAYRRVARRIDALVAFEPYVEDPAHVRELHEMRIAAKELRYALELFAPAFADGLRRPVRLAKGVQTLLGDIHDCDVWAERLAAFTDEERRRHEAFHGSARGFGRVRRGVEHLARAKAEERAWLHEEFRGRWRSIREGGRLESLREQLRAAVPGATPRGMMPAPRIEAGPGRGESPAPAAPPATRIVEPRPGAPAAEPMPAAAPTSAPAARPAPRIERDPDAGDVAPGRTAG